MMSRAGWRGAWHGACLDARLERRVRLAMEKLILPELAHMTHIARG